MEPEPYLKIGRAADLKDRKERLFFRFLEMLPGLLSWGTLIAVVLLSWLAPVGVAVFIIIFDLYWLSRTLYFSFLLRSGYQKMRQNEQTDWFEKLKTLKPKAFPAFPGNWQEIYHLIVFPMYKESLQIVRESFEALLRSDYPKDKMIVVLALEEKAGEKARAIGEAIRQEFGQMFFRFLITSHPADLPGEIAGKGSNETWALKQVKERVIDPLQLPYQNIIVSALDVDTAVFPRYFSCLTYHYLTCEKPTRKSYQPVPLFINNIWQAPAFSRLFAFTSTFWHTMNQERPKKLVTFSSHAMSFQALVEVGFKQTNVVSEDSRIFWQCLLFYDGDYRVLPFYYPISMDANVAKTLWRTLKNVYKQQRRWAYGVGDVAYFLFGFAKNKKIPLKRKLSLGFELVEGHWEWATASFLILFLGWLPLVLGGEQFSQTLLSYNLPQITRNIMTAATIGIIISLYFSFFLLPPRPPKYGRAKYFFFVFQWLLLPLVMIFLSSLPALEAQTRWLFGRYMGFWPTEKFRKRY